MVVHSLVEGFSVSTNVGDCLHIREKTYMSHPKARFTSNANKLSWILHHVCPPSGLIC